MTLQLELNPETEAQLAAEAAQHGMAPEAYALKLIKGALPSQAYATGTGRLTVEEFHKMLAEISEGAEKSSFASNLRLQPGKLLRGPTVSEGDEDSP